MPAPAVAWITHPDCLQHDTGRAHPERAARLAAVQDRLLASGLAPLLLQLQAPEVTRAALEAVHAPHYLDDLDALQIGDERLWLDPDTAVSRGSLRAARLAAGAVCLGIDTVLADRAELAFCAVRPPGHHAEPDRAMGFCFYNSVAVGAAHALARGLERVAVLDFDVHYGNGTAQMFRREPRVLYCSTYEAPIFPNWTSLPDTPNFIDAALPPGADGAAYRAAITTQWLPALDAFRPQLILVSAGFDAHRDDPLADLNLDDADYIWTAEQIRALAQRHCRGRVVATLEGGYDLGALARNVENFVRVFALAA